MFTELTLSGNIGVADAVAEHSVFGIDKSGTGAMMLSGNNVYRGGTDVRGGTLIAASDTALGTGALTVSSGATLEIAAGNHLTLGGAISFDDGSTLKLHALDAGQAALATTGGWTLGGTQGGTMNLHIGVELKAGVEYKVLSGLSSEAGLAITGQEGYRYTYTTSLRDGTYYITASDYEAGELTWANGSSDAVWSTGEQLWTTEKQPEPGSAQGTVGSASKDTVIFGAEGTKDVTVADAGVVVEAVQVTAGQDYRFEGGSVQANEVKVSEGSSVSHGAVYTVSQKDASADATIGKVEMASDSAAGAGSIRGQEGGEIAGLDNAVIEIAMGGKSLSLQDVMLKDTSSVAGLDGSASLEVSNVTLELGAGNTTAVTESVTLAGSALLETGGAGRLTLGEETKVYSIYSSALSSVFVTGSSLTLDLSTLTADMLVDVEFADYVAIRFGNGVDNAVAFEAAALSIKASYDGKEVAVFYLAADETQRRANGAAMPDTLYIASSLFQSASGGGGVEAVPEPTTATLSLLALSMLAARRRRR